MTTISDPATECEKDDDTDMDPADGIADGGETVHRVTVTDDLAGLRLDKVLADAAAGPEPERGGSAGLSRSRIKALIEDGAATVNGQHHADASYKVHPGDKIALVEPAPKPAAPAPEPMNLVIVHEDADLIVVDKPAGLVVHPAPGHERGTLVNGLLAHCGDSLVGIGGVLRPGIVHRIDKETSGLLVVAKTAHAHAALSTQFAEHTIERTYLAFLRGAPRVPEGRIEKPIGRSVHDRKKMAIRPGKGRWAATRFEILARYGGTGPEAALASLAACRLETGRTHQIRVHMADLGHPVLGDPVYGRGRVLLPRSAPDALKAFVSRGGRQALHAHSLGFEHPRSLETMVFHSSLPDDLEGLKSALEAL
ncbi:MAG: RluA family pseudouridine synthase [Alphaproteobacteria bacterium]